MVEQGFSPGAALGFGNVDGRYQLVARAVSGQTFAIAEPFAAAFDPAVLLVPRP